MPKRKTKSSTMRGRIGTVHILRQERYWSELPEDILHLFSKKLPDISDFIRFRAVCRTWHLSSPLNDAPAQLPWLLEGRLNLESDIIRFYCLLSSKVHAITCPGFHRALLNGPACRYLLAYHRRKSEMCLLNPLTRDQIHVPFDNVLGFTKYIGPDPIEGGDIVVISTYPEWITTHKVIAFCQPKANNLVHVEGVDGCGNAFYMGQYFSNDEKTGIKNVIDIATKKLAYQVKPPVSTNPRLEGCTVIVESGGKILRLFQHFKVEPCHFDMHHLYLDDGEGKPYWVKITDIGDQILFLQNNGGLSFCASNFTRFKGNCIYFLKYYRCLCRYDIGDGTTEVLPSPFDYVGTWFVPSLV